MRKSKHLIWKALKRTVLTSDFFFPSTTENEINLQFGITESAFFTKNVQAGHPPPLAPIVSSQCAPEEMFQWPL